MMNKELYVLPATQPPPVTPDSVQDQINHLKGKIVLEEGYMQSANFRTGTQGWKVDKFGNAEFNNGTFRGVFNLGNTQITVSDASDIQTAINTVSAAGGGIVYLASGTYNITSIITVYSNVSIIGAGADVTILDFGAAARYIDVRGTNSYTTGTVAVTNGGTAVVGTGTTFTSAMVGRFIRLEDFWYKITGFTDATNISIDADTPYSGLTLTAEATLIASIVENISLKDFTIQNGASNGINIQYANNIFVSGISANEITDGFNNAAVVTFASSKIFIFDLDINNCDFGIGILNTNYGEIKSINTSNTLVSGIDFTTGSKNWLVDQVNVSTTTTGTGMRINSCSKMTISSFSTNNTATQAISLTGSSNIVITSGSINTTKGAVVSGIVLNGTNANIIITNNNIINCTGYGINNAASTNTDIIIVGNYFSNNSLGRIFDLGTRTVVRSNSGGTDGVVESPQTSRVTTQLDKTADTTAAAITGLSARVEAGRAYTFDLFLFITADTVGGIKIDLGGGTATATSFIAMGIYYRDSPDNVNIGKITTLGTSYSQTGNADLFYQLKGTVVVNAAGTLIPRASQQVASGTSSILVNSTFVVSDSN